MPGAGLPDSSAVHFEKRHVHAALEQALIRIADRNKRHFGIEQRVRKLFMQGMVGKDAIDAALCRGIDDFRRERVLCRVEPDVPVRDRAQIAQRAGKSVHARDVDDTERDDDVLLLPWRPHGKIVSKRFHENNTFLFVKKPSIMLDQKGLDEVK